MTIRVLIADDQEVIRRGLRVILDNEPDIEVIGEAADGVEALAMARRLRPDVCLVDIRMPVMDGVEVTRALAGPGVRDPMRVLVVTTFGEDEYVDGALHAGALGFVLKDSGAQLLLEGVRAAHRGETLLSPSVAVRLVRQLTASRPAVGPVRHRLTDRELAVACQIAQARTNQEIAAALFISLSTVKGHVAGIQSKLGLPNRVAITNWVRDNNLTGPKLTQPG
ncbi:response regulator transcription factor [Actinoplanes sp. L3-i22]|uniref:response regulator transcription factor n=1 Tax=Actinoplanes sp. L3-i22 TaxID=2836373 RepID=UPI001C73E3FE|nr:response regulator transcription factor [Actinoplanes sp. L3-i22]BCY13958.1 DNA-binding response regulator [Actinoplanes sp. L3-i22]